MQWIRPQEIRKAFINVIVTKERTLGWKIAASELERSPYKSMET